MNYEDYKKQNGSIEESLRRMSSKIRSTHGYKVKQAATKRDYARQAKEYAKPVVKKKRKKPSKESRRAWWSSLTLEQQVDFIYNKMLDRGKTPDIHEIEKDLIARNLYMK